MIYLYWRRKISREREPLKQTESMIVLFVWESVEYETWCRQAVFAYYRRNSMDCSRG